MVLLKGNTLSLIIGLFTLICDPAACVMNWAEDIMASTTAPMLTNCSGTAQLAFSTSMICSFAFVG